METWSRNFIVYATYATAFLPYFFWNALLFPGVTTKSFVFFALTACVAVLFAYRLYLGYEREIKITPLQVSFVVLVGLFIVTSFFAENPQLALWSTIGRMEGAFFWLHMAVWFVITSTVLTRHEWMNFIRTATIAGAGVVCLGLLQFAGYFAMDDRVDILFSNPIYLAVYALWIFGLSIFLCSQTSDFRQTYGYIVIALFSLIVIVLTSTRSVIIGLGGGAFVAAMFYVFLRTTLPSVRRSILLTLAVLILGFGGILALAHTHTYDMPLLVDRLDEVVSKPITDQPRYFMWVASLRGFSERPQGWGLEQYASVFDRFVQPQYFNPQIVPHDELWVDRTHNMYLEVLVAGGFAAFFSYIFFCIYIGYMVWRKSSLSVIGRLVLLGLLVAYLIHNLFAFDTLMSLLVFLSVCSFIGATSQETQFRLNKPLIVHGCAVLLCVFAAVSLMSIYPRAVFTYEMRAALNTYAHDIGAGTKELAALTARDVVLPDRDLAEQTLYAKLLETMDSGEFSKYSQNFESVLSGVTAAGTRTDWRSLRTVYLRGLFLKRSGLPHEALPYLHEVHDRMSQKFALTAELVRVHRDLHDFERMAYYAKEMYDFDLSNRDAAALYASALIYEGKADASQQLLKKAFGSTNVVHLDLIRARIDTGELQLAKEQASALTVAYYDSPISWSLLAEAQYLSGDIERAKRTIDRGLEKVSRQKQLLTMLRDGIKKGDPDFTILNP